MAESWRESWSEFINAVVCDLENGASDTEVMHKYANQRVTWIGEITAKQLDLERPGVRMRMPAVDVRFSDGRRSTVDYLYVNVSDRVLRAWQKAPTETSVRFETVISKGNIVFPGIRWVDLGDKEGYFFIIVNLGVLLDG